ncbi:MAG: CCA tRNA nucleotidyltransferase [Gammaproteobacteria bacterium]|nr:CCA tRNA nucleotidyltransferase [Gammaproteobacteria bacterium]
MEDLQARVLRVIGDPEKRYQEDPVRMLRAVRFAAKLGFSIEETALAAILKCRNLLVQIPAARMFDEVLKLLLGGRGEEPSCCSTATVCLPRCFRIPPPRSSAFPRTQPAPARLAQQR